MTKFCQTSKTVCSNDFTEKITKSWIRKFDVCQIILIKCWFLRFQMLLHRMSWKIVSQSLQVLTNSFLCSMALFWLLGGNLCYDKSLTIKIMFMKKFFCLLSAVFQIHRRLMFFVHSILRCCYFLKFLRYFKATKKCVSVIWKLFRKSIFN